MKKTILLIYLIYLLGIIGWIKGIVNFCSCDFEPSYKAEIVYGIGSITGLGAILGWIDFGK